MTLALASAPPRLSFGRKLVYAAGQAGNVLGYQLVTTYVLTFYTPPEGKGIALVPAFLAGAIPTYLLLNVLARGFDTFWDPVVAFWSDRARPKLGRRRAFMAAGVLPLALVQGLLFFPPDAGSSLRNVVWLGAMLTAYYAMFSVYVAPYLALLPELAPDKEENTSLSTLQAAAALVGAFAVMAASPERAALQKTAAVLAGVSFLLMLLPVLFIDEQRLTSPKREAPSHSSLFGSLKATLSDRSFLPYVIGYTIYCFGFNMLSTGVSFYVEVLMRSPLDAVGKLLGPMFGVAALCFPLMGFISRKLTKRGAMVASSVVLAALVVLIPLIHDLRLGMGLFAVAGLPIAIYLSIPNAILADVCEASTRRTGERREAMFFGAQGFLQKIALGVSTGVFQWVKDAFGSSVEKPLGVELTAPVTAVALLFAAFAFSRYPEAKVTKEMQGETSP